MKYKEERHMNNPMEEAFRMSEMDLCFLQSIPGIGSKSMFHIYEALKEEGCTELWSGQGKEIVINKLQGICNQSFQTGYRKGKEWFQEQYAKWMEQGYCYISYFNPEYPVRLKGLEDPPFALWRKGQMIKEHVPAVAIVGARQCSEYGRKTAYLFGRELSDNGIQIISGMARGIDGYAQKGAVDIGGSAFAVLGCGVDYCYPEENRELYNRIPNNGGIFSEYFPGTAPESRLFPARNRIISGLSDLVLVVEARRRSGTYITVTQALEQGREVFAVPGRITDELSRGCHNLIKEGAGIAASVEDVLDALKISAGEEGKRKPKEEDSDMNEDERYLLSLMDLTPVDPETLSQRTAGRFSYRELNWILLNLKMKGRVDSIGNYYFRS